MDITGGSFTIVGDWSIAKKGSAIVNIGGGTIDIGDDLNIGPKAGEITFNMTGGGLVMASAITHLLDRSLVGCPYILKLHIRILHHQML